MRPAASAVTSPTGPAASKPTGSETSEPTGSAASEPTGPGRDRMAAGGCPAPVAVAIGDAPFTAPWQAQVFALVHRLRDGGVLGAQQWSQALGARLAMLATDADADAVWRCWVVALEDCLIEQGIAGALQLTSLRQSWLIAAEKTVHGEPIHLGRMAYRLAGLVPPAAPPAAASARATSGTNAGPR